MDFVSGWLRRATSPPQERVEMNHQILVKRLGGMSCINPRWELFHTYDHDLAMTLCGTWANPEETMLSFDSKSQSKYRHTLLYDTSQIPHFFNRLKIYGNPVLNKSISEIFPTVFVHFVFLSYRRKFHDTLNAPPAKRLWLKWWLSFLAKKYFKIIYVCKLCMHIY